MWSSFCCLSMTTDVVVVLENQAEPKMKQIGIIQKTHTISFSLSVTLDLSVFLS